MKWFLLATMCLPGIQDPLCIKMHGDTMYETGELCAQDRNKYFLALSHVANDYKGTFSIQCIDSFPISEFVVKK